MKKTLLYIALACASTSGLQSCLDFDEPGAELSVNQVTTNTELFQGAADSLWYKREISKEEAQAVRDELSVELGQCKTGIYNMRGGKEGGVPVSHAYQFQYNLETDNYAGYFVVTHQDFPYSNATLTSTYNVSEQFNGASHSGYNLAKRAFKSFLNHPRSKDFPELKAVYLLYFNLIAQENADISGPFTYTEDKNGSEDPKTYEPLENIYMGIKANLDSIVDCFHYCEANRSEDYKEYLNVVLRENDANGAAVNNYEKEGLENYIRLANSLKLRMAMHMSKVNPDSAKVWAEEAVKDGVIEEVYQQQGVYPSVVGFTHPLVEICNSWNDSRLNASFESLLMSLDHPYTKYLFMKNGLPIENLGAVKSTAERKGEVTPANTRIMGIRAGMRPGQGQDGSTNPFVAYSSMNPDVIGNSPLYFISLAEVNFLRAEGALRGWNMGGTAKDFYEQGIRHAYLEDPYWLSEGWIDGVTYNDFVEDYLARETPIPYVQVDPQGLGPDWPSQTKIGVTWNEADSKEVKLEKIITQKYIALFPNSHEAWTELRRTGYPKLFPVLNADEGDGSLLTGDIIRRVPWASTDPVQMGYIQETGIPALGGSDLQGTRLWWDVQTTGNFSTLLK